MKRNSQSGIALVITLILLSVITFMAVTFLVVSRREGAQVDQLTSQTITKEAGESGLQQAMGQIIANMQATTNGLNFGLFVSTNWNMPFYAGTTNITDVNYYYSDQSGTPLASASLPRMLNNLLILPRPPVFMTTNPATPYSDFRFYLDLNRNGVYDTNGPVVEFNPPNPTPIVNYYVGDPEWVGVLNHPDARHSASNFFISRYAFIALPIGNSLDVNNIYNQAKLLGGTGIAGGSPWSPGTWDPNSYLRNQGVGSWELNLAAFLLELNTNWYNTGVTGGNPYVYDTNTLNSARGRCFEDATAILQYRYAENNRNLRTFRNLYNGSPKAVPSFTSDFIDGYSHGPLMTGFSFNLAQDPDISDTILPWSGDYSQNQYFSTQDLFNYVPYYQGALNNQASSFSNFLSSIGRFPYGSTKNHTTTNSYNRYTFYRMLSQMSFGSAAEPAEYPYGALGTPALTANPSYASVYGNSNRMNLNYVNVGGLSATNFVTWTPSNFFFNAADRMLRAYFPSPIGTNLLTGQRIYLSITNIPIYPTNYYTPAVHRVLQLAANMYDSLNTNRYYDNLTPNGPYFPSVFAPYFVKQGNSPLANIVIAGYTEVTNTNSIFNIPKDLRRQLDVSKFSLIPTLAPNGTPSVNVYGIPYIVGARTGWPSFNKFSSIPMVQIMRSMELVNPRDGSAFPSPTWQCWVRYSMAVSNVVGVECWYPSTSNYFGRAVDIYTSDECDMNLTNNAGIPPVANGLSAALQVITIAANQWQGSPGLSGSTHLSTNSFKLIYMTNAVVLSNSYVQRFPPRYIPASQSPASIPFEHTPNYFIPQWGLNITNRVRLVMVDHFTHRIIDFLQLGGCGGLPGPDVYVNINSNLAYMDITNTSNPAWRFWVNGSNSTGFPISFYNQIMAAAGIATSPPSTYWKQILFPGGGSSTSQAQQNFRDYIQNPNSTNSGQVPFAAYQSFGMLNNTWSANDPLVHYTTLDLTDLSYQPAPYSFSLNATNTSNPLYNQNGIPFGLLNIKRYQPWNSFNNSLSDTVNNQIAYKDPMMVNSDGWQFPTNKFPNIGWLGRVHRGTPWQSVYLKSTLATANWPAWTGDYLTNYFGINDPAITQPANDWLLMDLFTTAPNDNAMRGQLSINQSGTAAWAAVLDGVLAVQNTNGTSATNVASVMIDPNATNNVNGTNILEYLVNCINATRSAAPYNGTFTSLGQICAVPQLTVNSPFLNPSFPNSLSDAAYERIPQQVMSLLRVGTPRYVIFAYGQSLKPAPHSIVTSGQYFGMCTNYQVTGEVATRAVVRFDNFPTPGHPASPRAVVESFNVLSPTQ